jgi:hypothetical protein
MYSNKLLLEPRHLEVSSGASKMISEPMVCLAQTVDLYCANTNTVSKQTEIRIHMTHWPRSYMRCIEDNFWAYGTFDTNHAPILHQDYHYLQMDTNKLALKPCYLGVSSGASKMIFSLWYIWHKPRTYLASRLALSLNGLKQASTWAS